VIHHKRTTALPKYLENLAHYITSWKLGDYYRTYPNVTVEEEVTAVLALQYVYATPHTTPHHTTPHHTTPHHTTPHHTTPHHITTLTLPHSERNLLRGQ